MPTKQASIIASGDGYAVSLDGKIVRDGFKNSGHASMWAARQGIYERVTPRRNAKPDNIPEPLMDERWLAVPVIADLQNRPYQCVLPEVRAGIWGKPIKVGGHYHVRCGDYRQKVAEREVKITAE
jgi:hypothetical protein